MNGQCHKSSEFNEDFMKRYNDEKDEIYFLEFDAQYTENLHNFHNDLPFLLERINIEKFEKIVANLHDKEEYIFCT